ncbi:hypothetical protein O4H49_08290 [Kiloniella laminariae]|uniref:Uncharacterized protein n=1 Tax=Kiloniella laminariae TaxID=454162 RepID=A0ABT4LI38_9PROT|nr:hypothetical protein [Kiloniella laminariae]MCZ4280773.1 hypothetical protein [Kiloniella laminariae]
MTDIRQKDLSDKPVQEMTAEERKEMRRRFEEFATLVGRNNESILAPPEKPKKVVKWDPRTMARVPKGD